MIKDTRSIGWSNYLEEQRKLHITNTVTGTQANCNTVIGTEIHCHFSSSTVVRAAPKATIIAVVYGNEKRTKTYN